MRGYARPMGDEQGGVAEPGGTTPAKGAQPPIWVWVVVGVALLAATWWLFPEGEQPPGPPSAGGATNTAAATGTPAEITSSPVVEGLQIEVAAQAVLVKYQGEIEALICEFELMGTSGFSARKLLDGSLSHRIEIVASDGDGPLSEYDDLRFGDETTDGEVFHGVGDGIRLYESIMLSEKDPFSCELIRATVDGEPVEVIGTTQVTAE